MTIITRYTSLSAFIIAFFLLNVAYAEDDNQGGIYWASTEEAIIAGTESCKHFNTPSVEEQLIRLSKKYGKELKSAQIVSTKTSGKMFTATRFDKETMEDIDYVYFNALSDCEAFQADFLKNMQTKEVDELEQRNDVINGVNVKGLFHYPEDCIKDADNQYKCYTKKAMNQGKTNKTGATQDNTELVSKDINKNTKSHKTKLQIKDDARKDFKKRCLDITYYPVRIIQKTNDYEYFGYVVDSTGYNDGSFPVILIYSVDSRVPQTTGMINLSAFQGLIELGRRNVTLENGFNAKATIIQVGDKICADLANKILGD